MTSWHRRLPLKHMTAITNFSIGNGSHRINKRNKLTVRRWRVTVSCAKWADYPSPALSLLTPSVDSVAEKFVTCFSGRLQCNDIIKCLLVTHLSAWYLFNFYCQFFTFALLNSVENVKKEIVTCILLRLSVIILLPYIRKVWHG